MKPCWTLSSLHVFFYGILHSHLHASRGHHRLELWRLHRHTHQNRLA